MAASPPIFHLSSFPDSLIKRWSFGPIIVSFIINRRVGRADPSSKSSPWPKQHFEFPAASRPSRPHHPRRSATESLFIRKWSETAKHDSDGEMCHQPSLTFPENKPLYGVIDFPPAQKQCLVSKQITEGVDELIGWYQREGFLYHKLFSYWYKSEVSSVTLCFSSNFFNVVFFCWTPFRWGVYIYPTVII